MDAIKYFETKKRMTKGCYISCNDCPFAQHNNDMGEDCGDFEMNYPEKAVEIVEKWAKEHPVKTRQSELLKLFPNAPIHDGVVYTCPFNVDITFETDCSIPCTECHKDYWLTKVGDE